MKDDLLSLLMLPTMLLGIIVIITTINVLRMSHPERMLESLPGGEALLTSHPLYASANVWARAHGFQWAGAYRFAQVVVLGWEHPTSERAFCVYSAAGKTVCEFNAAFDDDTRLSTSNMRDTFFLPSRPGVFKQAFLNRNHEAIWKIHCETETYFYETYGRRIAPKSGTFSQVLINSCARQMKHVRSLPLWPLRSPWWYCVNRFTKPNRPVRELYSLTRR